MYNYPSSINVKRVGNKITKGEIAPHLNVGWDEPLDTKPKPNIKLQRLQALFDTRTDVSMAEAKMYGVSEYTITDMAKKRGFEVDYDSKHGLKVARFYKIAKVIKRHEPRLTNTEKLANKFDVMIDDFIADASKNYVTVEDFMQKHGISKEVFTKLVAKVRYVLGGQPLETLNSVFEPRIAKQRACYYRLK